jgi:hypothetical protein
MGRFGAENLPVGANIPSQRLPAIVDFKSDFRDSAREALPTRKPPP